MLFVVAAQSWNCPQWCGLLAPFLGALVAVVLNPSLELWCAGSPHGDLACGLHFIGHHEHEHVFPAPTPGEPELRHSTRTIRMWSIATHD